MAYSHFFNVCVFASGTSFQKLLMTKSKQVNLQKEKPLRARCIRAGYSFSYLFNSVPSQFFLMKRNKSPVSTINANTNRLTKQQRCFS